MRFLSPRPPRFLPVFMFLSFTSKVSSLVHIYYICARWQNTKTIKHLVQDLEQKFLRRWINIPWILHWPLEIPCTNLTFRWNLKILGTRRKSSLKKKLLLRPRAKGSSRSKNCIYTLVCVHTIVNGAFYIIHIAFSCSTNDNSWYLWFNYSR